MTSTYISPRMTRLLARASLFLIIVFPAMPAGAVTFQPFVNYSTGSSPLHLVSVPFGGGGGDVAVIKADGAEVAVLVNRGDGSFNPAVLYPVGTAARDLVAADFNGDGKADLALADYGGDAIVLLLGNGDGTFAPKAVLTRPGTLIRPVLLFAADFNRDGRADLAVVNELMGAGEETLSLYRGNGDGTFVYVSGYSLGFVPKAGTTLDVNGDGLPDLAFVDSATNAVVVFLGDGTVHFSRVGSSPVGAQPAAVMSGDFNGDGKADLAVVNGGADSVSILLGVGDGTFQPHVDYAAGVAPVAVAAGDFNADGKTDLIVANSAGATFSLFAGNGDGTFGTAVGFATGPGPGALLATDLNADGKIDVVVAQSAATSISVMLNSSRPAVIITPNSFDFGPVPYDGTSDYQTFSIANSGEALLAITGLEITGTSAGMYTILPNGANPCPTPPAALPSGGSCTIGISFRPTSAGQKDATLQVTSNAVGSPSLIFLTGTGILPTYYNLILTLEGSGAGTVSVAPLRSSTTVYSTSGTQPISANSTVVVTATPDPNSLIAWTGCTVLNSCVNHTGGSIWVTMNANKSLAATFTHIDPARVGGVGYPALQLAYNAASTGTTIALRKVSLVENVVLDRDIVVDLQGGYGGSITGYDSIAGVTTLTGSLTVTQGTVNVAAIVISPLNP